MDRSSILAHRGFFLNKSEKNSPVALRRAINEGFGLETDLRDLDGKIVISHDPPRKNSFPKSFEWLLEEINSSHSKSRIGLNIKSDGLATLVESEIHSKKHETNQFFVFDMSVPDSLSYLKGSLPVYSRISDYEPAPAFLDKARGVWIDNFNGLFPQIERAEHLLAQGMRITIVSSELHLRDRSALWNEIIESGIYLNPLFEICTDFPMEAAHLFCEA
jgi:hypothetical protein